MSCSVRRACSGSRSSRWAPTPAWTLIATIAWATTSCTSRAIRSRSSPTRRRASSSRVRSAVSARSTSASWSARRSRTAAPSSSGAATKARFLGISAVEQGRRGRRSRSRRRRTAPAPALRGPWSAGARRQRQAVAGDHAGERHGLVDRRRSPSRRTARPCEHQRPGPGRCRRSSTGSTATTTTATASGVVRCPARRCCQPARPPSAAAKRGSEPQVEDHRPRMHAHPRTVGRGGRCDVTRSEPQRGAEPVVQPAQRHRRPPVVLAEQAHQRRAPAATGPRTRRRGRRTPSRRRSAG